MSFCNTRWKSSIYVWQNGGKMAKSACISLIKQFFLLEKRILSLYKRILLLNNRSLLLNNQPLFG